MTVFRALKRHGYFTSFNHNARYYTLGRTPRFDANGLWFYRSIGFSLHRTLPDTLVALVDASAAGCTASDLALLLHTPVSNLLANLARRQRLTRRGFGRHSVYLALHPDRQREQWLQRCDNRFASPTLPVPPANLPLATVLPLLTELIRSPGDSIAQLARTLGHQGVPVGLPDVQAILTFYQLEGKRGTLQVVELLRELLAAGASDLRRLGAIPADAVYTFDQSAEEARADEVLPPMTKTRRRRVISLRFGDIVCREVIRQGSPSGLERLVGKGMRYAFDVVAHVGVRYYLHSYTSTDIQLELRERTPSVNVPLSSLCDLCGYFLHLFGQLHRQRASHLRALLERDGKSVWLLDCTTENDSPVFFGVLETHYGILLGSWKMATENQASIAPCLREAVQYFGKPGRVLHDLGATQIAACNEVLDDVPDGICHFHFVRDVGEDLFRRAQKELGERLRASKLQMRLGEQRKDQTDSLRRQMGQGEANLVLGRLLAGEEMERCWTATLAREVLLAVHYWILDYARDGNRQGHPFDPHLLYLHRRLVRAGEMLQRLFADQSPLGHPLRCLANLNERLQEYCEDEVICAAAATFEKAYEVFTQLRQGLRLGSVGKTPMSETYTLGQEDQREVKRDLKSLCNKWREEKEHSEKEEKRLYEIALTHVARYETKLFDEGTEKLNEEGDRTTNELEREWRNFKRRCRRRNGHGKIKKEMQTMLAETLLVENLAIPEYVTVVLGSLEELPKRMAELSSAELFRTWKARQRFLKVGQPRRRFLRSGNFLDHLLKVCPPLDPLR